MRSSVAVAGRPDKYGYSRFAISNVEWHRGVSSTRLQTQSGPAKAIAAIAMAEANLSGQGFVQKDQPFGRQAVLSLSPLVTRGGNVGARLLQGAERPRHRAHAERYAVVTQ